jgi:hypothetical protein
MFMFKSRNEARKFKAGREGYVIKDLGTKAVKMGDEMYRWAVSIPSKWLNGKRVFA